MQLLDSRRSINLVDELGVHNHPEAKIGKLSATVLNELKTQNPDIEIQSGRDSSHDQATRRHKNVLQIVNALRVVDLLEHDFVRALASEPPQCGPKQLKGEIHMWGVRNCVRQIATRQAQER